MLQKRCLARLKFFAYYTLLRTEYVTVHCMPRRTILSAAQCAVFETLPTDQAELAKHYLLSDEDLELVQARRREENRLGFAVQLCLTR